MLIYDNEYETKENKNWTKDKIELQHIYIINHIYVLHLKEIMIRSSCS